jgi:hypothetical protein
MSFRITEMAANRWRISRAQVAPTNRDNNYVQYLSLKGAHVGVGWMRGLARQFIFQHTCD